MQREEIGKGWKKGKRFEDEGGAGALHWQRGDRWIRLNSGGIQAGGARKERHCVGRVEPLEEAGTQKQEQLQK